MRDLPLIISTGLCLSACGNMDEHTHPFAKEAPRTQISGAMVEGSEREAFDAMRPEVLRLTLAGPVSAAGHIDLDNGRLAPGKADLRLIQHGVIRTYQAHLPPSLVSGQSTPLIVVLPPTDEAEARTIRMSFDGLADSSHFAVVYPQIRAGELGERKGVENDDMLREEVSFISAVVADLDRRIDLDAERIFVVAHGSRVTTAQSLVCETTDLVAGLVTLSSSHQLASCALEIPSTQLPLEQGLDAVLTATRAWEFFNLQTR